jgi:hypothetical protein
MYPIVTFESARTFLESRRLDGVSSNHTPNVEERSGADEDGLDVSAISHRAVTELLEEFESRQGDFDTQNDADKLEVLLIPNFYDTLKVLPAHVLSDADYWRYLAIATPLISWVEWRDRNRRGPKPWPSMPADQSYGAHSASSLHQDTVPYRMFMRGDISAAAFESGATNDAHALSAFAGSDFWKSHILRGLTSYSPAVVAAAIQAQESLSSKEVRNLFPQLKRLRSNILFETLDEAAANDLVARAAEEVALYDAS